MKTVQYGDEDFRPIELDTPDGIIKGEFTQFRLDKGTVPEGKFAYDLRHGDDDSYPITIEDAVTVNFYGSIVTDFKITTLTDHIDITEWGFTD